MGKMCTPGGNIASLKSCNYRCKIGRGPCMCSYEVTPPSVRRQGGSGSCRRGTRTMAFPATCRRPFKGHRCMRCWCSSLTSRTRRPCPRSPNGWRQWHRPLASRSSPGWARIIPRSGNDPVWCHHSLGPHYVVPWSFRGRKDTGPWSFWCSGRVQATCLDPGGRCAGPCHGGTVISAGGSRQCGCRHRHTLDALGLGAVIEAPSGGHCVVIASGRGPGLARVDVIREIVQDYGWELVASGTQSLRVV